MNQFLKQHSLSNKNEKINNNSIKYLTITQSNNNIQEILDKYSIYLQKIKHFQIYNPINFKTNNNFSSIRLNTDPNRTYNNNKYINNSFKNNKIYNINSMDDFFNKYSKKIKYLKNIIKVNNNDNIKNKYLNKGNLFSLINNKNKEYFPTQNFNNHTIKSNNIYNQIYLRKNNNSKEIYYNNSHIINDFSYNSLLNDYEIKKNDNFQYNNSFSINKSNNINFINNKSEIILSYFDFTIIIEELINNKMNFFIYMFGTKDNNNLSWCRDCNIVEPFISNSKKFIFKNYNSILWINIPIDKDKKYVYKYNKFLKMNCIPTLIYFKNGIEIGRIIQNNLFNQDNINNFIIQSLNK
jgi:hypothetical protein